MFSVPQRFRVFCVKAFGLDADLTPNTERTMCGFVGMTLLFRGLIRLWWYLDLDLLIRVLILTMDVLLSSLISLMTLCAWLKARSQYSLRITGQVIPESLPDCRLSSLT